LGQRRSDCATPGLHSFVQVGYFVPDLAKAGDFFTKTLGAGSFLVREHTQVGD